MFYVICGKVYLSNGFVKTFHLDGFGHFCEGFLFIRKFDKYEDASRELMLLMDFLEHPNIDLSIDQMSSGELLYLMNSEKMNLAFEASVSNWKEDGF